MKYEFPTIETLDDIKPFVEDKEEFKIFERDGFFVANYMVAYENIFPEVTKTEHAILRECRGIKFCSKTGKILQRPFHKFFNVNERDETNISKIDLTNPHTILEKIDGSMICPILLDGFLRLTTKAGITDVSLKAESFIVKNFDYMEFCKSQMDMGRTPIFEYVSRHNRIVLDYEKENLILLAVRDNVTGKYFSLSDIDIPDSIPCVNEHHTSGLSIEGVRDIVSKSENEEGVIIRFDDGHMLKVKSEWYCQLHKMKELMSNERNLAYSVLNQENLDDLKSLLSEEDRKRLEIFENSFWKSFYAYVSRINELFERAYRLSNGERKYYSLNLSDKNTNMEKSLIFSLWDGDKNTEGEVFKRLEKHLYNSQKYDIIKEELKIKDL